MSGLYRWRRVRYLGHVFEVVLPPRYNDQLVWVSRPGDERYAPITDLELL